MQRKQCLGLALVLGLGNFCAFAETSDYGVEISQKFARGLGNVLSSPLEIPCTIRDEVSEKGGAGIGTGFFKGLAFFGRRLLVGVDEAATFLIPMEATLPKACVKKPAPAVQAKTA